MDKPVLWTNAGGWASHGMSAEGKERLIAAAEEYRVVFASDDPKGAGEAEITFGQPDPETLIASPHLKWAQLTSAGFTRYDRADLREAFAHKGAVLTNSSHVYNEPCAQHVLAMLLAVARQLPQSHDVQRTDHSWPTGKARDDSFLVGPETTIVFLGYGAIVRRLAELLAPFRPRMIAARRQPKADTASGVEQVGEEELERVLPLADHLINVLPESPTTRGYLSADRMALLRPDAFLYNIGRGATVDQEALLETLQNRRIAGAYLDVTTPEPLPPGHPLWTAPNCWITPHSAGGHQGEEKRLLEHFLANLQRWKRGEPLLDIVTG